MPHVIVKLYPGSSKEQKKQLARQIVKNVTEIAVCEEKSVSVAFEEVEPDDWAETVYRPDIINNKKNLVVTPGYNPFQKKESAAETTRNAEFCTITETFICKEAHLSIKNQMRHPTVRDS